jgi:alkylated DNA nucleotide flippase Atl1
VNHAGRTAPGWTEQRQLLEKEGVEFKTNGCVDMDRYAITADDAETIQKTMESNR